LLLEKFISSILFLDRNSMDVSLALWAAAFGLILVMPAVDRFANRHASVVATKESALW
jgi:tellurite resistance protein TerC